MGCDIHMAVELRAVSGFNRADSHVRALERSAAGGCPQAVIDLEAISVREGAFELAMAPYYSDGDLLPGWHIISWPAPWALGKANPYMLTAQAVMADPPMPYWDERDYEAFGIMASVRRPGAWTIAQPRGVPEGFEADWMGDHSFSWLSAKEILSAPQFREEIQRDGLVSAPDYAAWRESGDANPRSWCRGTSCPIIDETELQDGDGADLTDPRLYIRCSWKTKREFGVVDMAQAWADRFGVDAVRFVFGFDS